MSEIQKYMDREQILKTIEDLSKSQGLYCRILNQLNTIREVNPDAYERYMAHLEGKQFKDPVDLVLFFES